MRWLECMRGLDSMLLVKLSFFTGGCWKHLFFLCWIFISLSPGKKNCSSSTSPRQRTGLLWDAPTGGNADHRSCLLRTNPKRLEMVKDRGAYWKIDRLNLFKPFQAPEFVSRVIKQQIYLGEGSMRTQPIKIMSLDTCPSYMMFISGFYQVTNQFNNLNLESFMASQPTPPPTYTPPQIIV